MRRPDHPTLICPLKKRKADSTLPRPTKRPATGAGSKPDFSDADDEDEPGPHGPETEETGGGVRDVPDEARDEAPVENPPAAASRPPANPPLVAAPTSPAKAGDASAHALSVPIVPSSQDSAQSGSDSQNPAAESEKTAKAALHILETATGIHVSQKHRGAMVEHSLALGKRQTLETFRQACRHWRKEYAARASGAMAPTATLSLDTEQHPALQQFSTAYHGAQKTAVQRAVVEILYRVDLAHLYGVYLSTLKALSPLSAQPQDTQNSRPREVFDLRARTEANNQMFWACYPQYQGMVQGSFDRSLWRRFNSTLEHGAKWHALREEFGIGMLPLVPRGANSWFEALPFGDMPIYLRLITAVNPVAVAMAEMTHDWTLSLWGRAAPPEQRLRLEHLETIDEILFKANPLQLLEGVDVGYVRSSQRGRAVTMPANTGEDDIAALDAAFSSVPPSQEQTYYVPPGFYNNA